MTLVIYHGGCADGFTAAWAVRRAIPDADFWAATYQDPPPSCAGRDVVIVDFSFKRDVLHGMAQQRDTTVVILDHHKSAAEDLQGLPPPLEGAYSPYAMREWQRECNSPNALHALFDMERSGAGIAWDYFNPNTKRPALINYVEDRDLWRFRLPRSREVNAYIFAHAYDFASWDRLALEIENDLDGCADMGAAIEKKHHKDVAELVGELRREMIIGGHWAPVASLPRTLTSDAGSLLCEPYASDNLLGEIVTPLFGACYWDTKDGRVFSLRSRGDFDVSEVAKLYGGGGHKNAAGFRVPYERLSPDGAPQ